MKFFLLLLLGVLTYWSVTAQNTTIGKPVNLKEGVFYIYPEYFTNSYKLVRKGNVQQEYMSGRKEPTEWSIGWKSDSVYTLSYLKGGSYTEAEQESLKKVTAYYTIDKFTQDYYVYTRYDDRELKILTMRDTIWLKEKAYTPLTRNLFVPLANKQELEEVENGKEKDYAVLYFYTPLDENYNGVVKDIYIKNGPFGYAANGLSFAFKFQKEGDIRFFNHLDDKNFFNIHIAFGKSYFIKTTFSGLVNNPRVNFKLMDNNKGREESEKTVFYEFQKDK